MRTCRDCGRQLVDVTGFRPDNLDEFVCACHGRTWLLDPRTNELRYEDEPPAAAGE